MVVVVVVVVDVSEWCGTARNLENNIDSQIGTNICILLMYLALTLSPVGTVVECACHVIM